MSQVLDGQSGAEPPDCLQRLLDVTRGLEIRDSIGVLGHIDRFRHFGSRIRIPGFPSPARYDLVNNPFGFPWARDLLAEAIICTGSYLNRESLSDFGRLQKSLRVSTDYCLTSPFDFNEVSIWNYMGSVLYQQMPDQRAVGFDEIITFYKIYDHSEIRKSFQKVFGCSLEDYFRHIFIIYILYKESIFINWPPMLKGISYDYRLLARIFRGISKSVEEHRNFILNNRLKSHKNKFYFSTFVSRPVMIIDIGRPEIWCPFVGHLLRRLTYGVYYDLIENEDFANYVGYAFEKQVGRAIELLAPEKWQFYPEAVSGKRRPKSSADWLIVEGDAAVFIECKFKRPLMDTKIDPSNQVALTRDLDQYGKFCAQSIVAAERERAGMFGRHVPKGANCIIIVTPEDWLILNGPVGAEVRRLCVEELERKEVDPKLIENYKIMNMGYNSFEIFLQAAARFGLSEVLLKHSSDRHLNDFTPGFVLSEYVGREGFELKKLWREDFDRLIDLDKLAQA